MDLKKPEETPEGKEITLKFLHWNILADRLAHESFSKVHKEFLSWDYRFSLILQHIEDIQPDVFDLIEVDVSPHYQKIADAFARMGYMDYFV